MKRLFSLCLWGVAGFFCILGIAVFAVHFFGPTPGLEKSPPIANAVPAKARQSSRAVKPTQPKNKELKITNDLRFISAPGETIILTPFGPCGTVARLAPTQFGFSSAVRIAAQTNTGIVKIDDPSVQLYSTAESALTAAGRFCGEWYQQEKANRSAAQEIQGAWQEQEKIQQKARQEKQDCYKTIMTSEEARHAAATRQEDERHEHAMKPLSLCCFLPSTTSIAERQRIAEQNSVAIDKEDERHSSALREESNRYFKAEWAAQQQGCQQFPK